MTNKLALILTLALVALSMPLLAAPPACGGPQASPAVAAVQAPAPGVGTLPAGDPAPAATALPAWAGPLAQPASPKTSGAIEGRLFASCSDCVGIACFHRSCVLLGCC